jgi:hypothetical protein
MHANHLKKTEQLHQLCSDRLDRSPPLVRPVLNMCTGQHSDRSDRWPRPVRPVHTRAHKCLETTWKPSKCIQ